MHNPRRQRHAQTELFKPDCQHVRLDYDSQTISILAPSAFFCVSGDDCPRSANDSPWSVASGNLTGCFSCSRCQVPGTAGARGKDLRECGEGNIWESTGRFCATWIGNIFGIFVAIVNGVGPVGPPKCRPEMSCDFALLRWLSATGSYPGLWLALQEGFAFQRDRPFQAAQIFDSFARCC